MFTGLVEEAALISAIKQQSNGIALTVDARVCGKDARLGDSIAVNGCCLTVTKISPTAKGKRLQFDLLQETWNRTSFASLKTGSLVNLERSLRAGDRLGGHFVTGHVDGVGKIVRWERSGNDHLLDIAAPADVMRYVIYKGSIAVDGISLTVAGVKKKEFRLWIIPHTYEVTSLQDRKVGSLVNLEADLLGKYVERFVTSRSRS
jgi:riboflavin synthase